MLFVFSQALHTNLLRGPRNKNNLMLTSEETAVEELAAFAEAGGKTIVEVTPLGIGRDAAALKRIQEGLRLKHIDVHIVCGTSYYVDLTHPEGMDDRSAEDIAGSPHNQSTGQPALSSS